MNKVYAFKRYASSDELLIKHYEILTKLKEEEKQTEFKNFYKKVSNSVRVSLNSKNVVGLVINNEHNTVLINEYDILATEDNFYKQRYDNDTNKFYIDISKIYVCLVKNSNSAKQFLFDCNVLHNKVFKGTKVLCNTMRKARYGRVVSEPIEISYDELDGFIKEHGAYLPLKNILQAQNKIGIS